MCAALIACCLALALGSGPMVRAEEAAAGRVQVAAAPSCIPKGDTQPNQAWGQLNIVRHPGGGEMPTPKSLERLIDNQTSQIALDPVRNMRLAFISGVTLEAPAGTEDWTVVETATCPPARWAGALVFDPLHEQFLLWGGTMSFDGPTNDLWVYSPRDRDWRSFQYGSDKLRRLNAGVEEAREQLETLRWDLWKTLEWEATGRQGAVESSALAARLEEIGAKIDAAATLARKLSPDLAGYEAVQAAGADKWLASAAPRLSQIHDALEEGSLGDLESGYRALMSLRADIWRAADSVQLAPPSRYFIALNYDEKRHGFMLDSTVETSFAERWIFLPSERRWERLQPAPGEAAPPAEPDGEFVLRDAASLAELQAWQAQTSAWAESIPVNTWVRAPAHGTGRPNWGRSWSSIVYDPDRRQLYYRDGGHGSYHGNVTDHYDIPTGRWFRRDVVEVPSTRIMGPYFGWGRGYSYAPWATHTYKWNLFYNPLTGHLQRRGVLTPDKSVDGDLHDYDPDQGKWSRELATLDMVGMVVPGVEDAMVGVRGWSRYSGLPSAIVTYRTADGTTTWANTGPIAFHGANRDDDYGFFYDPPRKRVVYYGGEGDKLALHALDLQAASPRWERLDVSTADGSPLPLAYREWIYIARHDMFLTMEWQQPGSKTGPKLWSFNPQTNQFRRVKFALGEGVALGGDRNDLRSSSVAAGLAYDPVSDVAFYIHAANKWPLMFAFRYEPG